MPLRSPTESGHPMDSWRDIASEAAQEALDDLLNSALELAGQQVAKQGGFLPFALTRSVDGAGRVEMVGDDVDSTQMIDTLWADMRELRDVVVAVAVVTDVRLGGDGWPDGIRVEAEHRDGIALDIVAPYRRRRLRRSIALGEFGLEKGERRVW
jgi:hypothetical protein